MEQVEGKIRDELSTRLELLEPGLELVKKEQFLPNPEGTRGFVDLFATDESGKYVLVELKRSASASREALHEVLKYLEALKVGRSARDSEIRIFIVSTVWSELLIPFSSFVSRTSCEVVGFALEVDSGNVPISAKRVQPIKLTEDRLFAPWHELNLYESEETLRDGVRSYELSLQDKGIENYAMAVLTPPPGFHQKTVDELQNYMASLNERFGGSDDGGHGIDAAQKLPEYRYILYFATLRLTDEQCWNLIDERMEPDELEDFRSYVLDMEENDEKSCALHTKVFELEPKTKRDYYEIGYPAKFGNRLLEDEGWSIVEIKRYGTLSANEALSDDAIIDDLRGDDGQNLQKYRKDFSPSNASELSEVRAGVKRCLRDNPLWRNQILRVLEEDLPTSPDVSATISVFNPGNLCLALYRFLTQEDGMDYLPYYMLHFEEGGVPLHLVFGSMQPTGTIPSFTKHLDEYYGGSGADFLQSLSWGGYKKEDVQISQSLGMTYATYKVKPDGDQQEYWKLTELGWDTNDQVTPYSGFQKFAVSNRDFASDVVNFYSSHWDGVMWNYDRDEEFEFIT